MSRPSIKMDPILIVDDEKDNLQALNRHLRNLYEVVTTDSPIEALKHVQNREFNVIISDQRMPEMTGVEFLEKVRAIRPRTTRILLTGYTDIDSVIGAINRGNIYRYVAKPWDPDDLELTLRQANEAFVLRREIEERNEELKRALDQLLVLDRAKARFLSLVSHELNTPLTVLTAFVDLLSDSKAQLPEEVQKAISSIAKASRRFDEIVQEVITFVGVESDTELHLSDVDLEVFTKEAVQSLSELRAKKQVALKLKTNGPTVVRADEKKIKVAIEHLIKDAILRSPVNGEIALSIDQKNGQVCYRVERSGETLSTNAFKPLEFSEDVMKHQQNLGLSLAIAKTIIDHHQGEISLDESSAKNTSISIIL